MNLSIYSLFILSVISCSLLTIFVKNFALRHRLIDNPKRARKIHNEEIPRFGGVSIITSFVIVLTFGSFFCDPLKKLLHGESITLLVIVLGGIVIFFLGIFDDYFSLSHKTKLLVEIATIAIVVWLAELSPDYLQFPILGTFNLPSGFGSFLACLWIAGMINAINFVDGLDGLATGISLIGLLGILVITYYLQIFQVLFPAYLFSGCLLGFLIYNSRPACIFLGDCGSLTTGYFIGCFSLLASFREKGVIEALFPVILFAVPIADCSLAIFRRFCSGRSPFYPDVEHIHHRLMSKGLSHGKTVIAIWLIALICAYISVALEFLYKDFLLAILVLFLVGCFVLLRYLNFFKFNYSTGEFNSFVKKRKAVKLSEKLIKDAEMLLNRSANHEDITISLECVANVLDCDEVKLSIYKQLKTKKGKNLSKTDQGIEDLYWKNPKNSINLNNLDPFVAKYPLAGRNIKYGEIRYSFISNRSKIEIHEEIQLERFHDALVALASRTLDISFFNK